MENRQNPTYRDAYKHGGQEMIRKAVRLCRDIGKRLNDRYGPKYQLEIDNIVIYVDDYGGYSTISADGNEVASNHTCDQYYVSGEWETRLNAALMIEPSFIGDGV